MEFKDFIARQASRVGKKQVDIVRATGASKGTISQWFGGTNKPGPRFYAKLCRVLLVDYDVLLAAIDGEISESFFNSSPSEPPASSSAQFTSIPMVESFYHAGNGEGLSHSEEPAFLKSLSFRTDWLEYMGLDIGQLKVCMVHGRSMEPTLNEADVILVDRRESEIIDIENGAIYALVFKEKPLVKRVYVQELGGVKLESDNGSFDALVFSEEEAKEIEFVGRVVWRGGEVA